MAQIEKGVISTIEAGGKAAKVAPINQTGRISRPVAIPWFLRGDAGRLEKGTEVAYAIFADQSGVILSRMDGEWYNVITEGGLQVVGPMETTETIDAQGTITAPSITAAGSVKLESHTHGGVASGPDSTSGPQ